VDPSGRFLYAANFSSANVSAFRINAASGALTASTDQPFPLTGAALPFSLVVSPSGKFVYVANRNSPATGSVSVFTINLVDGTLSEILGSPFAAGAGPRSIAVDPSGKFVFVANEDDSTVSAFTVSPTTGALSLIGSGAVATGNGIVGVAPFGVTTTGTIQ
jgi:6-phosphogluconolactonase (cycloisomerase 2 family)